MHAKTIISCSLPFAWQEAVKFVRKSKHEIIFGGGSEVKHAVDSQVQLILDKNAIQDALNHIVHPSDPFCTDKDGNPSENRIMGYIKEYERDFDAAGFSYTYYQELIKGFIISQCTDNEIDNAIYLDQIEKLKDGLDVQIKTRYIDIEDGREKIGLPSNRNIAIIYNPLKWNMNSSSPCWDILWIRLEKIDEDGTVWVSICTFYRSHDLTDAWESNFIAQVTMIMREILEPLNAKILFWHECNVSLHIYKHNLKLAKGIKEITANPMLASLQRKYDEMR